MVQPSAGDRLFLWGGFEKGDKPVLELSQLVRAGESSTPTWDKPAIDPRSDTYLNLPIRHGVGGIIQILLDEGGVVEGRWERVERVQVSPPSIENLGWGWVAKIPYVVNGVEFRLFGEDHRLVGSEKLTSQGSGGCCRFKVRRILSRFPERTTENEMPSDVVDVFPQATHQTIGAVEGPGPIAPHGVWTRWRKEGGEDWHTLVANGTAVVQWPAYAAWWGESKPLAKQDAERPARPVWSTLVSFHLSDPSYPLKIEIQIRRAYGFKIYEEDLHAVIQTPPPEETRTP